MEKLPLTTRQQEILEYMGSFTRESGYPPTVREICRATGLKSPRSVSQHLQSLERKGYIQRGRDKSRAIRFLDRAIAPEFGPAVALQVRGRVTAGPTAARTDDAVASFVVDRSWFAGSDNFLMRVDGDCMAEEHIVGGDYIVVSPDSNAEHGDVVVARIGAEVSVKRYERRNERGFLTSQTGLLAVDGTEPRIEIVGRVVGLIRPAS